MSSNDLRIESDSVGAKKIPMGAYYGVQSLRAYENFNITGKRIYKEQIIALAEIKKAAAIANHKAKLLTDKETNAIIKAADEIISGNLHNEFICDPIQGGAGTSANMNANEVIANRANEILGGELGKYKYINPNDHVNMGQSTNDVFPTSGKITSLKLISKTLEELEKLYQSLFKKSKEFNNIIKMGRTQMQDAVPIRLGQEFGAYAAVIKRDIKRINIAFDELKIINMGASAIGTGINVDTIYFNYIVPILSELTGLDLKQSENLVDGTQNLDGFVNASSSLKTLAVNLSKISNDLRIMSSGPRTGFGEINLPAKQNGSSIMPGKVNPVIPEVINQVSFNVIGNDMTIAIAAEGGQLELNAFEPIIFYNLFESIVTLSNGIRTFRENCIDGITVNEERVKNMVHNSVGIITAIVPHVGYKLSASIANKAIITGEPIRDLIIKEKLLTSNELDEILDEFAMTEPGIAAKHLLNR